MAARQTFLLITILPGLLFWAGAAGGEESRSDPAGPSTFGQRGLYRSWAAQPYESGSVVLGSAFEFFKASDFLVPGDENQRLVTRFSLAIVPFQGLEVGAGFSAVVNHNPVFAPQQSQSMGDPYLWARYGHDLTDWLSLGGGVQVLIPTGQSFSELSTDGISTRILTSFDFKPLPELLIALNIGYHFDNSGEVFAHDLNPAQRFSAGVNPHDQLLLLLGVAWQLGPTAPFLEYGASPAVGDGSPGFGDSPNWLTIGVRVWPLSHHTLHLAAAVDIGLAGVTGMPEDKARIPPYNVILAAGFDFGSIPEPPPRIEIREVVQVQKVEVPVAAPAPPPPEPKGRIVGVVQDAQTGKPLGGVRVVAEGKESGIYLTDPETGSFSTCPAEPGPVKLTLSREGYAEKTEAVLVKKDPRTAITIELQESRGETFGTLKGTVRSATGEPLAALVSIPARRIKTRSAKKAGTFKLKIATGVFDVIISRRGFITQRRKIRLKAGDLVILNVELFPKK